MAATVLVSIFYGGALVGAIWLAVAVLYLPAWRRLRMASFLLAEDRRRREGLVEVPLGQERLP